MLDFYEEIEIVDGRCEEVSGFMPIFQDVEIVLKTNY